MPNAYVKSKSLYDRKSCFLSTDDVMMRVRDEIKQPSMLIQC